MRKLKLYVGFFCVILFLISGLVGADSLQYQINTPVLLKNEKDSSGDFYFIHLTDTHVVSKFYDHRETRKQRLISLLDFITAFESPPAFIVITGDLVEWGEGFLGALNYVALVSCFYTHMTQLYADTNCSIPVYFTPGNHDHYPNRQLYNYHLFIDRADINENDRYVIIYQNLSLFFMNSGPVYYGTPSDWDNSLGLGLTNDDIVWLDERLQNCPTTQKIILMHHPAINIRNDNGELFDVFIHNREQFIELCETYDVDVVLAGHTHEPRIFNAEEQPYKNLPMNSSNYPTLFVQSDDCKEGIHYRNISIVGNNIWIESSQEIDFTCSSFINSNLQAIFLKSKH